MKIFLSMLVFFVCFSLPALAESTGAGEKKSGSREIVSAGDAMRTKDFITETPFEYINFYDRRFDYKESRDELRANIEKRRRHYNSARTSVIRDYNGDLHDLHSKR